MADVYICAFSRVIDWNGLKNVLQMLEPKDIAEVTHRVEICSRTRGCVFDVDVAPVRADRKVKFVRSS